MMNSEDEKKERLEQLEKRLYSRKDQNIAPEARSEFSEPTAWQEEPAGWAESKTSKFDDMAAKMSQMATHKNNFIKKIFVLSLAFFVVAVLVAAFVFWGGLNMVSSRNVDIQVVGPLAIAAGQETSFDIDIHNGNNTDLKSAILLIEYPKGTRSSSDVSVELQQDRLSLGDIKSGETYTQNIKAIIFGEKESVQEIKISLEYRVENSSALFYKEKTYEVAISSSPVIITPVYPKEVNSNQEVSFNIEITSNSKDELTDLLVKVEYPFGFVFNQAYPAASFGDNLWKFTSLSSGETRTIKITGNIIGQDNEERVFRITTGTADPLDERVIGVSLSELTESILVKKPFIGVDVNVAGKDGDAVIAGGQNFTTNLKVRNNLPERLFNVSVLVSLSGGAFDGSSVSSAGGGFFQSADNTILWDKRAVPDFSDMAPGSARDLSFTMSPKIYSQISGKPEINMTVKVSGERVLASGSVDRVETTEQRKVVLSTDLNISSRVVRSLGNLENSGPIPPKVGTPTTYTIIWNLENSFNQVSNAEVRATLPPYVKWTNIYSPTSELISFNADTNEVVWRVGSILPNTGFGSSDRQIYFQLEFLPSTSQLDQSPMIMGGTSLSGVDKITGFGVTASAPAVTTRYASDPTFKNGDDKVVP